MPPFESAQYSISLFCLIVHHKVFLITDTACTRVVLVILLTISNIKICFYEHFQVGRLVLRCYFLDKLNLIALQGAMTFFTELIFENARCSIDAADCALIIGVTYFLSSILGLVLKKHIGRRVLLLGNVPYYRGILRKVM